MTCRKCSLRDDPSFDEAQHEEHGARDRVRTMTTDKVLAGLQGALQVRLPTKVARLPTRK
jgi:hypothetical protein